MRHNLTPLQTPLVLLLCLLESRHDRTHPGTAAGAPGPVISGDHLDASVMSDWGNPQTHRPVSGNLSPGNARSFEWRRRRRERYTIN